MHEPSTPSLGGTPTVRIYRKTPTVWTLKWRVAGKATATSVTGTRKEAETRARQITKELSRRHGGKVVSNDDAEVAQLLRKISGERSPFALLRELERAEQILDGHSLIEAAGFYAKRGPMTCERTTFKDAVARFLKAYQSSPVQTVAGLRKELQAFAEKHARLEITSLTEPMLEDWITRSEPGPRYFNNRLATWKTFLNRCRDWKYLPAGDKHPGELIKPKRLADKTPEILSVRQCKQLLDVVPEDLLPYLAVGCFAGVRPFELMRLKWEDFIWERKYLHVRAEVAGKTSQERFVPLQDNLLKLLAPWRNSTGKFCETHSREKLSLLAREKKILHAWPMDVMRHSFCSYRLAQTQNIGQVAEEAGNSPTIIRRHYRRPLTKEDGDEWFKLGKS